MDLAALNRPAREGFTAALGGIFEHSPWVAAGAHAAAPFDSVDHLHAAMPDVVARAGRDAQVALLRAHPVMPGREALEGSLTADSSSEQGRLEKLVTTDRDRWCWPRCRCRSWSCPSSTA